MEHSVTPACLPPALGPSSFRPRAPRPGLTRGNASGRAARKIGGPFGEDGHGGGENKIEKQDWGPEEGLRIGSLDSGTARPIFSPLL